MATSIADIKGALVTKLGGVSTLNGVYNYEPDKPTDGQYPFATVTVDEWDGEFGDTIRNIRRFTFAIRVYQERTQAAFGNAKAEGITDRTIDEMLTAFDADTTLSGMVKWIKPLGGNANYVDREIGDTRIAEIVVEATVVVPSIT